MQPFVVLLRDDLSFWDFPTSLCNNSKSRVSRGWRCVKPYVDPFRNHWGFRAPTWKNPGTFMIMPVGAKTFPDNTIADFAVAAGVGQIKTGSHRVEDS